MIQRSCIYYIYLLLCIVLGSSSFSVSAQSLAERKAAERYEIDAKRSGTDINSDDALPRSREFKRIDSTYYVGWMFEGVYKYNHAADYNGFRNAIAPLEKAIRLMERDYKKELSTRTDDLLTYFRIYNYHLDYTLTAYYLAICYSNTEEPEKIYALMRKVLKWRFQRDFYMDAYNYLAWTTHRNRFYTKQKYSFLSNSIEENEQLAHRYLDSGMRKIQQDKRLNATIFQPGYELGEQLGIYHYKSILHSYAFHIDSAEYYYGLLRKNKALPYNNYGTFQMICGNFKEAATAYAQEAANTQHDKRLQEWVYYSSIIDLYRGRPAAGIALTEGMIRANGSTPGFGWYNIALARSLLYNGQFRDAASYIRKSEEFKELHIGTTLGQAHYDFSVQILKLKHTLQSIAAKKFENKHWWYTPSALGEIGKLTADKYFRQFLIINQFSQNPERDRVIYKLFSTESTVSWDEIWLLIKDFSTGFFLDKFRKEQSLDPRENIHRYFQYFIARLMMEQGKYPQADILLQEILENKQLDTAYEKLFIARILEAQAVCALKEKRTEDSRNHIIDMYRYYPQLIPFSEVIMPFRLTVTGHPPEEILQRLKQVNIQWGNDPAAPEVRLQYERAEDKQYLTIQVIDASGKEQVPSFRTALTSTEKDILKIAYRLFSVGEVQDKETE